LVPLNYLQRGEWAEVVDVSGETACVRRMAELGLRVGAVVRMLQPGSTCLLEMGASRLSMRTEGCVQVYVEPIAAPALAVAEVA